MTVESLQRTLNYASLGRQAYRLKQADDQQLAEIARKHLAQRMGKMRGLPQKLGQMLSFSHAAETDEDTAGAFDALQESADPLPLETVAPRLEEAWGQKIETVLSEIRPDAFAASLGQVHQARLHDGRDVAVKIQYPGIRDAVMHDLRMLGWLSIPVGNLRRGFDLSAYQAVILEDLNRELDYRHEAQLQAAFADWSDGCQWLVVPRPIDALSTDSVLVSEWEEGERWQDVKRDWSELHRRKLARILVRFFIEGLFQHGLLHADWHPGNFRFRRRGDDISLLVYDFGCVFQPTLTQRLTLLRLIRATGHRDEPPLPLLMALGFNEQYLEPMVDKLPALCQVMFEPFISEAPYDVSRWRLGERIGDILGDDRWNFRIAGAPQLIFLLRAMHGLNFYLQGLGQAVSWSHELKPHLQALGNDADRIVLPSPSVEGRGFASLSKYLKIRVQVDGETKVQLTSPASAIDDLEELLPSDVKRRIDELEIDLASLVSDVRRRGYTPGEVFRLEDAGKQIEAWLE